MTNRIDAAKRGDLLRMLDGTGIDQGDMASHLGMDEAYLSRVLNGKKPIPDDFLENWTAAVPAITEARHDRALAAVGDSR